MYSTVKWTTGYKNIKPEVERSKEQIRFVSFKSGCWDIDNDK